MGDLYSLSFDTLKICGRQENIINSIYQPVVHLDK